MLGVSLLSTLLVIWGIITVALVVVVIYRAVVGIHEEDQLFLDRAEAAMEREQVETLARIRVLDPILKVLAIASGGLLLVIAAVWLYRGLYGPPTIM
ncbi:MAG: hypothetical protein HY649_05275 [Acidobacteria bacterium]|nr:hypothetical protein [Acidobacteriota bacterium]